MRFPRFNLSVFVVPVLAAALCSCATTAQTLATTGLRIGLPESSLMNSPSTFKFAENGHFGEKVQYNGVLPDEFGGAYAVHCLNGKAYGIEIKYQQPIDRAKALKVAERICSGAAGALSEHDDTDLKEKDAKRACEFFYYAGGVRCEFSYVPKSTTEVNQITIWKS